MPQGAARLELRREARRIGTSPSVRCQHEISPLEGELQRLQDKERRAAGGGVEALGERVRPRFLRQRAQAPEQGAHV